MKEILWVVALLGVGGCCGIQNGGYYFNQNRNYQNKVEIENFYAGHVKYDVSKHFAAFCQHYVLLPLVRNTHLYSKMA